MPSGLVDPDGAFDPFMCCIIVNMQLMRFDRASYNDLR